MLASADLIFFDFETRGRGLDLKAVGTPAYSAMAEAIVCAYAIGDGSAQVWHAGGAILDWNDAPAELKTRFDDGALMAAWNASFDSAIWNYATLGFPFLPPERVIDPMMQAGISNLPTDLEGAARYLGRDGKQKDGKKLIKLFSVAGAAPADYPEEWARFLAYGQRDVEAMREVYQRTRPLPRPEWEQYWAFERINRRGVCIDAPFVARAAALAAEDATAIGRRLVELTDGAVTSVGQAQRIAAWLHDQLPDAAMREALTVGAPAGEDEGDEAEEPEPELSLTRNRVARVLAMLEAKRANGGLCPSETKAFEAATLRLYGAGASPKKFARIAREQVGGVIRDQYRFAGAGQTGRASGRGIQVQNLTRDTLGAVEAALIDLIADGCSHAELAAADPSDISVTRKLALLTRPALIAGPGKVFVWSDWSAIEARVTPWLAASPEAEEVLEIFRACDADPSLPDNYARAAADILHKDAGAIDKAERAIGKVATLALGFGGAVGALKTMALNYRIHLDDDEARRIVDAWRDANPWAPAFWGAHREGESFGLWGAAMTAWEQPGRITSAGRLGFVYRDYLGGSLFMALPSGRLLTYPRPEWREVDILDKDGEPTGERRRELSFRRAHGRAKLWRGTLCENAVQATAADLLRAAVTRIETNRAYAFMPIRLHTHDEILVEAAEGRAEEAKAILRREMLTLPDWAANLPLQSEESVCRYYTKSKAALHDSERGRTMNDQSVAAAAVVNFPEKAPAHSAKLNLAALHAAAQASGTSETRYWLNGVQVEIAPRQTIYVATDGLILFAYHDPVAEDGPDNDLTGNWIIPTTTIKAVKLKKGSPPEALLIAGDNGNFIIATGERSTCEVTPIDGTFPDWRRAFPREVGKPAPFPLTFDPALVARLWKAGAAIGAPKPYLAPSGACPALVHYASANAIGLIMPTRSDVAGTLLVAPDWAAVAA
jgi:DNA polymerase